MMIQPNPNRALAVLVTDMAGAAVGTERFPLVAMVINASPATAFIGGMFAVRDQLAVDADLRTGILKRQRAVVSRRDHQRQMEVDEADLAADRGSRKTLGEGFGPVVHRHHGGQPAVAPH